MLGDVDPNMEHGRPMFHVGVNVTQHCCLAMSTLAIWSRVVQSRDVSRHNFDALAISVAPLYFTYYIRLHYKFFTWPK